MVSIMFIYFFISYSVQTPEWVRQEVGEDEHISGSLRLHCSVNHSESVSPSPQCLDPALYCTKRFHFTTQIRATLSYPNEKVSTFRGTCQMLA